MKRILCLLCVILVLFSVAVAGAESIQPFYLEAYRVSTLLSISDNGIATCCGEVKASHSNTSTKITLTLKKSADGNAWSSVKSWNASGSGLVGAAVDETCSVAKGYQYKVTLNGEIYDSSGKLIESVSKTSSVKTY